MVGLVRPVSTCRHSGVIIIKKKKMIIKQTSINLRKKEISKQNIKLFSMLTLRVSLVFNFNRTIFV